MENQSITPSGELVPQSFSYAVTAMKVGAVAVAVAAIYYATKPRARKRS